MLSPPFLEQSIEQLEDPPTRHQAFGLAKSVAYRHARARERCAMRSGR